MADYRFSAQVISRGKGQSSVASAAYRSASRLVDERTGEIHDYTRKQGVTHSEVMTPKATPEWMQDRQQLWSAVEAVERRKDAQLAREVQLSLPHELTNEQRTELVRGFIQEQFVSRGMIADIAIHAPSDKGDDRNHHAHVMFTMRELTDEGFANKRRDWNSPELLAEWREQWAQHQNRALERHGHPSRVSHLSYEAQGIDREPTQHLGQVASDMERNGKPSRIGDENREIANDNHDRAKDHAEAARLASEIAREKWKLGKWADYKRGELENAQKLADLDFSQKEHRQTERLEAELRDTYGTAKATIKAELDSVERRLQAKGVRKILRDVFGSSRSDKETRREMTASLKSIEQREQEQRQALAARQELSRTKEAERQQKNRNKLEKRIQTARERREATNWQPRTGSPAPPPAASPRALKPEFDKKPEPEVKSFNEPTLADKTTNPANREIEEKPSATLKRPWQRSSLSNDNKRPWERDDKPAGRERSPDQPRPPKK